MFLPMRSNNEFFDTISVEKKPSTKQRRQAAKRKALAEGTQWVIRPRENDPTAMITSSE